MNQVSLELGGPSRCTKKRLFTTAGMDLFDKKIQLLQLYYPSYSASVLTEILRGCHGDVAQARLLIDGPAKLTAPVQRTLPVKRKDEFEPQPQKRARPGFGAGTTARASITLNTPEDVAQHLGRYALLHPNFFPKELADGLLDELAASKEKFHHRQFYLFGTLCQLNVLVAPFAIRDSERPPLVYDGLAVGGSAGAHEYSRRFELAAKKLEHWINDTVIPQTPRLPFQRKDKWKAEFCVANMYEKLSNHLDWHSDRLSSIGPHNFIALVLLGLTRVFKLRSTHTAGPVYLVPLPHNSVFLMRPGCQEEYKHTLGAMTKLVLVHPVVGTLRFSLTFRHYPSDFIRNLPKCRCGIPMLLRRAFKSKDTRGMYFWLCENVYQNKDCGAFEWANFDNWDGHFVAASQGEASRWLAPE